MFPKKQGLRMEEGGEEDEGGGGRRMKVGGEGFVKYNQA
jgi:hypothetical protein